MPDFDIFPLLEFKKLYVGSRGKQIMATLSVTFVQKKCINTSLKDFSAVLHNHAGHHLHSTLNYLPIFK